MDEEVYRGYRIAIKIFGDKWVARISHVRGSVLPIVASASDIEGQGACAKRARQKVDQYMEYLTANGN